MDRPCLRTISPNTPAISPATAAIRRDPRWPGGARVAVQFVVNYEEGGERNILHGDADLGSVPVRCPRGTAVAGAAAHEHGVDVRIRLARGLLAAVAVVHASATCRSPCSASRPRWRDIPTSVAAMREARLGDREPRPEMDRLQGCAGRRGARPSRRSDPHPHRSHGRAAARLVHRAAARSRPCRLVLDEGGFLYSSDSYADDLPYWVNGPNGAHLIIPYTLDANDMRFINAAGLRHRRGVLHLSQGCVRPALCRGRDARRR